MNYRKLRQEVGQSLILIALLMIGMIAFLGLVIDGGRIYGARRLSQNASDAGAFAGARQLFISLGQGQADQNAEYAVLGKISCLAERNGIAATGPSSCANSHNINTNVEAYFVDSSGAQTGNRLPYNGLIPSNAAGVTVRTYATMTTFFLGVINEGLGNASAHAKVMGGALTSAPGVMPFAVPTDTISTACPFIVDQLCQLQGSNQGPGQYQYTNINPNGIILPPSSPSPNSCPSMGNNDLTNYLNQTLRSGPIPVNAWVCAGPGQNNSDGVQSALTDYWFPIPEADRIWIIPIYDQKYQVGNSVQAYHISGFAVFVPVCFYFGNGNGKSGCASDYSGSMPNCNDPQADKCIWGKFKRLAVEGDFDPTVRCVIGSPDYYGACAVGLRE